MTPEPVPSGAANSPDAPAGPTKLNAPAAVNLTVLRVQVPRARRPEAEKIWSYLQEEILDSERMLGLRRNGVRVGTGHAQTWNAVKAGLDAIDGCRSNTPQALHLPAGFPLALELDSDPREQTLFYVDHDGILSGSTWPQSRNVLRVTYTVDPRHVNDARLAVVPEVRQRLEGLQWVRTDAGLWQTPKYDGRAFPTAGVSVTLAPGEFLLLAPSRQADVYGLVGGVFLTERLDGGPVYDSYIFLRPDTLHVGQRD